MKQTILILAVILFGASIVFAQKLGNHGLVITGSVQGVEIRCLNGKPVMQVRLYIQLRNDGETRLLLVRPSFFFTKKVNFVADKLGDPTVRTVPAEVVTYNPYLENPFGTATIEDYDPFPSYISQLDAREPPVETLMVRIDPGGYHEFQENIWLKTGFQIGGKSGSEQKECKENSKTKPVPAYPAFSLEYHMSLKKYDRGTELLSKIQNRWKRFGYLPLDSNGDFSLRSEKIVIDTSQ